MIRRLCFMTLNVACSAQMSQILSMKLHDIFPGLPKIRGRSRCVQNKQRHFLNVILVPIVEALKEKSPVCFKKYTCMFYTDNVTRFMQEQWVDFKSCMPQLLKDARDTMLGGEGETPIAPPPPPRSTNVTCIKLGMFLINVAGLELRIWKGKAIFKKGTLDFEGYFG